MSECKYVLNSFINMMNPPLPPIVYSRGSQPGGRVPLGGLERSQISDLLGTFVPVGGRKWS